MAILHTVFGIMTIIRLNFRCSPSAIVRAVISVIINPIYRVGSSRLFSHVFVKINKLRPSITNSYASAPISWVFRIVGVMASASKPGPRSIFWGAMKTVRSSRVSRLIPFFVGASTGSSMVATYNDRLLSTIAQSIPVSRPFFSGVSMAKRGKGKLSLSLSSSISRFWASCHSILRSKIGFAKYTTFTKQEYL